MGLQAHKRELQNAQSDLETTRIQFEKSKALEWELLQKQTRRTQEEMVSTEKDRAEITELVCAVLCCTCCVCCIYCLSARHSHARTCVSVCLVLQKSSLKRAQEVLEAERRNLKLAIEEFDVRRHHSQLEIQAKNVEIRKAQEDRRDAETIRKQVEKARAYLSQQEVRQRSQGSHLLWAGTPLIFVSARAL